MTDHNLEAEPAPLTMRASASLDGGRSAESWQFFAFNFAACVALTFALVDDLPLTAWGWEWGWCMALKVVVFVVVGYFILRNERCREWQVRLLMRFKEERG
jgi:hypothetical protein